MGELTYAECAYEESLVWLESGESLSFTAHDGLKFKRFLAAPPTPIRFSLTARRSKAKAVKAESFMAPSF